jgi:glycosyltransferase involved in cell wall biosynthesis
MRVGQNPAKSIEQVAQPQRITAALVTYIPFLHGYYAQSLEVLKLCLNSLYAHSDLPYDLLVFDNASCPEVRSFLQAENEQGRIQFLVQSQQNIGKSGAWNMIFSGAPGEIIAYADSDVYFYPGWLSALVRALELSPKTGMVTGMPLLNPEEFFTSTTAWAENEPGVTLESGQLLPWEDFWQHAGTLGGDEAHARQFYQTHDSYRLTMAGQQYYLGAGHFQFVARKSVLQQAIPLPSERPMGQVRALDVAINSLGYLRLSTPQWYVQHLGNHLDGWQPLDQGSRPSPATVRQARSRSFWSWPPVRRILVSIYEKMFQLLYR